MNNNPPRKSATRQPIVTAQQSLPSKPPPPPRGRGGGKHDNSPNVSPPPADKPQPRVEGGDTQAPREHRTHPESGADGSKILSKWKAFATAAVIALCIAAGIIFFGGNNTDEISEAEKTRIQEQWAQIRMIEVPIVKENEYQEAFATMLMGTEKKQQIKQIKAAVTQKQTRLVWLTLWDSVDEDGDIVVIQSDGYEQSIPLWHAPKRIAIPEPTNGYVRLSGVQDGGGGITVGVLSGTKPIPIPFLAPGASIGIPVQAGL